MNITSGIKLKKFNSKQNKKMMKSQESIIKKEKSSKPTKISPLFSHKKKNMENQTKTPDKKTNFKPNLTHEFFYNQDNNNKMLSKFILQEKKDKINNSTFNKNNNNNYEQKLVNDKKNKTNIINNNNYFIDNRTKKIKQITQLNYQNKNKTDNNNNNNNININKITKKIPQDNMRNKTEEINSSNSLFEVKKFNNNDKTSKYIINDYIKIENENKCYISINTFNEKQNNNNNSNNNNNDNNNNSNNNNNLKIIFNNTVKKSVIETKTSGSNLTPSLTDEELENIFLLNKINSKLNNNSLFDSLNDLNLSYSNKRDDNIGYNKNKLLYIINDEQNYIYKNNICSTIDDYDNIIKNNLNDKIILSQKILKLKERNWYNELTNISDELKEKRENLNMDNNFNKYLKKIIKIYEHFNWLINSISIYYNLLFQKNKQLDSNFSDEINLPEINSPLWKRGFKWKGVYINIIPENNAKYIKEEIKALNYFFFDYLQIIDKYTEKKNNRLSNEIIFPLIGYSIVNGRIIYVSVLINPDKSFNNNSNFVNKFIDGVIHHNKGYVDYYLNNNSFINSKDSSNLNDTISTKNESINESLEQIEKNYYFDDLLISKLFTNMCQFHLIPIHGNKFVLVNLYNSIPNLFEIKYRNYRKIHLFSVLNNKKYYNNFIYNKKTKIYCTNNNQAYKTPKAILEKYKINITQPLKIKDIIINKVHFRILYEKQENIKKNLKTRTFVDNLFNYYNNINEENYNIKYIEDHYIIIYDLIEPIKLEYSIIKNIKKENNNNNTINKHHNYNYNYLFYLYSNYISFFLSWCKALNKNSFNIKTYSELKYSMKRFGIISQLKFFSLVNIDNDDITDIIKISLLVKLIKYIFNKQDNNTNYNDRTKYLFENERIERIFFLIQSILYINEILPNEEKKFEQLYEELVFYINIIFLKLKLIDDYLSLGLLNEKKINEINIYCAKKNLALKEDMDSLSKKISGFDSIKDFLKNIIFTARKKPFLFLSELELKLNFSINPFIKFKSSLSIESMSKKLKIEHLNLDNNFKVYSYVNSDELAGLILSKLIYDSMINNEDKSIQYYEEETNKKNMINKNNLPNLNNNYNHFFIYEENDDFSDTKSDNNLLNYNFRKKNMSSQKSSLPPSPLKSNLKILEKENILMNWYDIKDFIFIKLPSLCYKMNYYYEESTDYNNDEQLYTYLKDNYKISENEIFIKFYSKIEFIFNEIYSCTGKVEQTLLHSLFHIFIIYFFMEQNKKEYQKINKKIKEIYSKGYYLLSFADLGIINLFQGLSNDYYINSEEQYSKSVMLFLMLFGDPRGRNNDSHALLHLPLWKIARKTLKLREQPSIYQYFLEMYKSLEFFQKDKGKLKTENNKTYFDHEKNIMNNLKNILKVNNINLNIEQNEDNSNNNIDSSFILNKYFNKDMYLSHKVFNEEMLNIYRIKNVQFLSVEDNSKNVNSKLYTEEFIIYLIKHLESVLIGNYKIYDEKYINDNISYNIFNIYEEEKKISLFRDNNKVYNKSQVNIKSEPKTENKFESFFQNKNIFDIFPFSKFININNNDKLNNSINTKNNDIISNNIELKTKTKQNRLSFTTNKKKKNHLFSHYLYDELLEKLSYRKNCPSGIVISFGNNSYYETAHEDNKSIKYPLLIYKLKNIRIKKIYSGWEHNLIISNTNEIYSFGHNKNLQCGIPINNDKENIKIKNPTNISILNKGIKAISAACGNEHSLILDEKNNVYSFGNNEDGVLGIENDKLKSSNFIKIDFGKYNNRIKSISAGTVHNIALSDDGKVFAWGSAQGGQLGLNEKILSQNKNKNFYISTPTLVPIKNENPNENMKIVRISCGEAHTIVLNNKNEVYSWGFGSNGQLGLGFCEDSFEIGKGLSKSRIFTPKKIKSFENKTLINDIQCGKTFSMFISTNGELYSCGVNDLKQLGIPDSPPRNHIKNIECQCKDFVIPTKLEYFLNMKVEKISCGEAHCVAIIKEKYSNERIIWSWGNNRYGQLGLGDKINFSLPKPNTFLFEYKEKKYESVSCGGFHSLCLINYNEDLSWIENDFKNIICKLINDIGMV